MPVWVCKHIDQLTIGAISLKENHHIATLLLREVEKDFFFGNDISYFSTYLQKLFKFSNV